MSSRVPLILPRSPKGLRGFEVFFFLRSNEPLPPELAQLQNSTTPANPKTPKTLKSLKALNDQATDTKNPETTPNDSENFNNPQKP